MKHCGSLFSIRYRLKIIGLFCFIPSFCQDIAVGTWRTHFSYFDARLIQVAGGKVFCAAGHGLFSRDFSTGSSRTLSKIDGLSDAAVTAMGYAPALGVLILGYESGVIDLLFEDHIVGITDVAASTLVRGKRINDIAVRGTHAYLGSDFGVVVVRLNSGDVSENYLQIGAGGSDVIAESLVISDDSLFVLTAGGVQSGDLRANLLDFNNWVRYPGTSSFGELCLTSQGLYANDSLSLVRYEGGRWRDSGVGLPSGSLRLFNVNDRLYTASGGRIYAFNGTAFDEVLHNGALTAVNDVAVGGGRLLIADGQLGLTDAEAAELSPGGPVSDIRSGMKVIGEDVYVFHAPDPGTYDGSEVSTGYSLFSEGSWSEAAVGGFTNVSDAAVFNGVEYFTSVGDGLYINGVGVVSDIPGSAASPDTILTGIASGRSLYVSGYGSQSFHALDGSGRWTSYDAGRVLSTALEGVLVSVSEVLWLLSASGSITVFAPAANRAESIGLRNGLPSVVSDFTISASGRVWIATRKGPVFLSDASFISSNFEASFPSFEGGVLFEDEPVNAILTDGGRRVWFGTNRGLWVFDEAVSERSALFNASNSPLPSDVVTHLAYNESSGEVFIGTSKGLVSYRSASSAGLPFHSDVTVFPNPVRPGYQGKVGISGLVNNAVVKITDINGNLVKELHANGGSASWDLLTIGGVRVVTGIYYLFSASRDGKETFVGKVAVVR